MTVSHTLGLVAATVVCAGAGLVTPIDAHKPITSPYTYNEDVFTVVRERCGACHVAGGVAPMSLMTHQESVPWGESIRAELIGGHMPPWRVESAAARFRNASGLTARELNILLTWVTGGTPLGRLDMPPPAVATATGWSGGVPDVVLQPEEPFTLGADRQQATATFALKTSFTETRWLRAVDVLPGTAAMVRRASASIQPSTTRSAEAGTARASAAPVAQRVVALWLPGERLIALEPGSAFELPPGAVLSLQVEYRKTWEHEHTAMSDRSQVGLYFATAPAMPVRALTLAASEAAPVAAAPRQAATADVVAFSRVIDGDFQALAIYPDAALEEAGVRVSAVRPDGSIEELIAFHPPAGWQRRYWFTAPVALPRGTRIDVRATFNDTAALLPPGATPRPRQPADPARVRLTLDVIAN